MKKLFVALLVMALGCSSSGYLPQPTDIPVTDTEISYDSGRDASTVDASLDVAAPSDIRTLDTLGDILVPVDARPATDVPMDTPRQ